MQAQTTVHTDTATNENCAAELHIGPHATSREPSMLVVRN
jgi:hypothetical protein